ncbi:hypothetical protein [Microcoleus sp. Pol17_C1]|uniref:hypothetical protein n=1 Tax=unclassified Microcoleus TaxID=2642155 RepID=UPI002FD74564
MRRILLAVALFLGVPVASASGPAYKPFPEAQVTPEQWIAYRASVHAAYGATLRVFPDEHLEVLYSDDEITHFAFTMPGHPAHPAWITRQAQDGSVGQIGYFAGDEAKFAELFRAYLALTDRTLEEIPDEGSEQADKDRTDVQNGT